MEKNPHVRVLRHIKTTFNIIYQSLFEVSSSLVILADLLRLTGELLLQSVVIVTSLFASKSVLSSFVELSATKFTVYIYKLKTNT